MAISQEEIKIREEEEFQATEEMYESFLKKSLVWKDITGILERVEKECISMLANPNVVNTLEALADYQSRLYMIGFFKGLPETILQIIKTSKEEKKNG